MKKVFMTLAAVAAFGMGANAQTGDVKFGFKGGYNLSNLGGDVENCESLSGFHLGGFVEIPVNEKFSVQPEILYSTQGVKVENFSSETKFKMDYINIPIMAKYYVMDKLAIMAGPQIGILAKAESEIGSVTVDTKDNVKSVDFGIGLGANYYFTENIFAGARYNIGLSDIDDSGSSNKLTNNVLQVSVGYRF